ncbi:hypothetical protein JKF63_06634 [Porcisia hertigi]|uniref:Uncharacterized protein n=1 Tax=Porcisia hertigi TaxID=2761500 RepID=A0A836IXN2_9TRYP|nr:hypothetical protein JKF63_06634 [Porcisia hertigi]
MNPLSAEAALRLCHSAYHADDNIFWSLLRGCENADEPHKPAALRAVLSLFAACVKSELYAHAKAASATAAGAVTVHTFYSALKVCARCAATLPSETRRLIGLDALLATCFDFVRTPGAWQGTRRWRRLHDRYPELTEMLATAKTASATTSSPNGEGSTDGAANDPPSPLRHVLLSPKKESATTTGAATALVTTKSAVPVPDAFAEHLRQTERVALAAQWWWRTISTEVTSLRERCAALKASAQRDEAAAEALTLYLAEVSAYVQALRCAGVEVQRVYATAASTCSAPSSLPPSTPASLFPTAASTAHELRSILRCALSLALAQRSAVDDLLSLEQDAVHKLDVELARLRANTF